MGAVGPGEWHVHTVAQALVLGDVLHVVEYLKGGAQGVRRLGGAARLAVQVEEEPPHRRGGGAAIAHQFVPVGGAVAFRIAAEGGQQGACVPGLHAAFGQHGAQLHRRGGIHRPVVGRFAAQRGVQRIQRRKLGLGGEIGRVGDIVGEAGETVIGAHRRAGARCKQQRRDRKVFRPPGAAYRAFVDA